jgi:hypothetical protein
VKGVPLTNLESKDVCALRNIEDDAAFRAFSAKDPTGLEMVAEPYGEGQQVAMKSDAGHFAKWLRANSPDLNVVLELKAPKLVLRSGDIWLPLTFLASDIALPVYLNLIASYLYDRMKGALKGESTRVHFCAEFEDKANGKTKRFTFDGDADALQKAIKRFDVNDFLDE